MAITNHAVKSVKYGRNKVSSSATSDFRYRIFRVLQVAFIIKNTKEDSSLDAIKQDTIYPLVKSVKYGKG